MDLNLTFGKDRLVGVVIPNGITSNGVATKADGRFIRTNWSLDSGKIVGRHARVIGKGSRRIASVECPWLRCECRPSSEIMHHLGVWSGWSSRELLDQSV